MVHKKIILILQSKDMKNYNKQYLSFMIFWNLFQIKKLLDIFLNFQNKITIHLLDMKQIN